ncbi:hypothetical protein AGMMS50212_16110 [Spirochaetia bacterium]|nr:hypothetical protein AGMMS50212_16110 [Spirochaetia bacterium]
MFSVETLWVLVTLFVFAAISGNSVLPVVFVAVLLGFIYLSVKQEKPELGRKFEAFLEIAYAFVLKAVHLVINLTPYGILAIISGGGGHITGSAYDYINRKMP